MKMDAIKAESDSDSDDTLTSPACSDHSGDDESDREDVSDSESISLSVVSTTSTVTSKKSTTKKRVSFKPGDSLVLIYEIPNRAMLGLKSDSESSDDDDDDSDDEESDSDSSDDSDSDDDDDETNDQKSKNGRKIAKSLPKLLSVKQVSKRNNVVCKTDIKRNSRKVAQLIGLSINPVQPPRQKRRSRRSPRIRSSTERSDKMAKKEPNPKAIVVDEVKRKKTITRMSRGIHAISNQSAHNKRDRTHRNRRFLEIKATLQTNLRDTSSPTPRVTQYKQDLKPSIATLDARGAISVCGKQISQNLTQRARLQPTSFRLAKTRLDSAISDRPVSSSMAALERDKCVPTISKAMTSSYEPLPSLKRLDPDNMNAKSKRNYAWQVANGRISSHQLRTPSILPFWDSLQNSINENNVIKLPT